MANIPIFSSRRVRSTPYTERLEAHGLAAYTVYNHMLLPNTIGTLESDYEHLKQHVQIWDVAAERQVEVKGKDARKLAVMMSARDLRNAKPGVGYYTPICDANGGMLNDPIALCLAEDHFWFSIADADMLQWALGLATGMGLDVEICEPDVSPLAVQGPKAEDLMAKVFGEEIRSIKFFRFQEFDFEGVPMIIQRSGWSKQGGFEIYMSKFELGSALWETLFESGSTPEFNVRAGCPNHIERIEGGLLSYGNDMTREDTPLECKLDRFVGLDSDHDFIGKKALLRQREEGIKKQLVGVKMTGEPKRPLTFPAPCYVNGEWIGQLTSSCYSPSFDCNIAVAMVDVAHAEAGSKFMAHTAIGELEATVHPYPFTS